MPRFPLGYPPLQSSRCSGPQPPSAQASGRPAERSAEAFGTRDRLRKAVRPSKTFDRYRRSRSADVHRRRDSSNASESPERPRGLCTENQILIGKGDRAASGHAAAAPPTSVMNSRGFMGVTQGQLITNYV